MWKLELIIKERRLRWLGHVLLRMDDARIPRQATQWELRGYKRKPGRPRKNWMYITWDEAEELMTAEQNSVAQCTHLDAG